MATHHVVAIGLGVLEFVPDFGAGSGRYEVRICGDEFGLLCEDGASGEHGSGCCEQLFDVHDFSNIFRLRFAGPAQQAWLLFAGPVTLSCITGCSLLETSVEMYPSMN
jgi:hypothetical protein